MVKRTRRFIAGARCPQCEALDRLALETVDRVLCVACGYTAQAPKQQPSAALTSRVERPARPEQESSPVRIMMPDSKKPQDG